MRPAEELAQLWAAQELDPRAIDAVPTSAWKTYQLVYFLDKILQKSPLPPGEKERAAPSGLGQMPCASWVAGDGSLGWGQVCMGWSVHPRPGQENQRLAGSSARTGQSPLTLTLMPSDPHHCPVSPGLRSPGHQPLTQPTGGVGVWPGPAPALQHECPVAAQPEIVPRAAPQKSS